MFSIGVLLLNACLTVRASQANSHKDKVLFLGGKPFNNLYSGLIFGDFNCFRSDFIRVGRSLRMQ